MEFTDEQIEQVKDSLSSLNLNPEKIFIDILSNTTIVNNEFALNLQSLADEMDQIINDVIIKDQNIFEFDYIPKADAGGPYFGLVNQTISIDGSNSFSSSISNITKYAWDLDMDGEFDDSSSPNPTIRYGYPANGFIGLKVTNQDQWSDISYSRIDIQDINYAPIINNFTPPEPNPFMVIDETLPFSISASDPNNDDLSIEWLVDNQTSLLQSNSFNYMPSFDDIGSSFNTSKNF